MPVSGIVVSCTVASIEDVVLKLSGIPGIEVHGTLPQGKIVAVVEADTVDQEVALVTSLQDLPGVVSVQLAYHNFEESSEE